MGGGERPGRLNVPAHQHLQSLLSILWGFRDGRSWFAADLSSASSTTSSTACCIVPGWASRHRPAYLHAYLQSESDAVDSTLFRYREECVSRRIPTTFQHLC